MTFMPQRLCSSAVDSLSFWARPWLPGPGSELLQIERTPGSAALGTGSHATRGIGPTSGQERAHPCTLHDPPPSVPNSASLLRPALPEGLPGPRCSSTPPPAPWLPPYVSLGSVRHMPPNSTLTLTRHLVTTGAWHVEAVLRTDTRHPIDTPHVAPRSHGIRGCFRRPLRISDPPQHFAPASGFRADAPRGRQRKGVADPPPPPNFLSIEGARTDRTPTKQNYYCVMRSATAPVAASLGGGGGGALEWRGIPFFGATVSPAAPVLPTVLQSSCTRQKSPPNRFSNKR